MDKEVMVKKDILHKYFEQLFFRFGFLDIFLWRKFVIFHIKIKLFFGEKFCNRIKAKEMCKSHSLFDFMQRMWICTFKVFFCVKKFYFSKISAMNLAIENYDFRLFSFYFKDFDIDKAFRFFCRKQVTKNFQTVRLL